jgi:hypothetical protein
MKLDGFMVGIAIVGAAAALMVRGINSAPLPEAAPLPESVPAPVLVASPPRSLVWNYDRVPYITFNVYTSGVPLVSTMQPWTNTSQTNVAIPFTEPGVWFFAVKATNTISRLESDWATTGQ